MNAAQLKARGYRCRREVIVGQGYLGGDGVECYRVRDKDGSLPDPMATYRTARGAWESAASMIEFVARLPAWLAKANF